MPVTQIKKSQAVREQVSKEEWETRVNLAACYRLMHVFGMTEMIANHISARVPGSFNFDRSADFKKRSRCASRS